MANHMDICGECRGIFDGDEPCDECQYQAAKNRIASLEAEIEAERGRAETAEADRNEWKGVADGRLIEIVDLHAINAAALARAEKAEADSAKMLDEWETMYAGRECPKCRYHVTMNVSDDPPAMVAGRMKKVTAAARSDAVKAFAEWLDASGPKWFEAYTDVVTGGEITMSFPEAAARFLARKEPTDG